MFETPLSFVVFSTNTRVLRIVNRLIDKHEAWSSTPTGDANEVLEVLERERPNMFLVAVGAESAHVETWEQYCETHDIALIQHYGGGSGLLYNSIMQYLNSKEQKS